MMLLMFLSLFNPIDDVRYLENYLQAQGHELEPSKVYVVVSGYSCISCSKRAYVLLNDLCEASNLVVISSEPTSCKASTNGLAWIQDIKNDFDYMPYNFSGLTIVQIENREINRKTFGLKNLSELSKYLADLLMVD